MKLQKCRKYKGTEGATAPSVHISPYWNIRDILGNIKGKFTHCIKILP